MAAGGAAAAGVRGEWGRRAGGIVSEEGGWFVGGKGGGALGPCGSRHHPGGAQPTL